MVSVAIEVTDEVFRELVRRAESAGLTPAEYIEQLIEPPAGPATGARKALDELRSLRGSWEDDRTIEQILAEIDAGYAPERDRPELQ